MKLVSVIVPVYNVVNTLEKCVESILCQTYKNVEIVLVDDGSTDGSGSLCDKYQETYSNIIVIHKENEGLGPTRNRGVAEANGEYIYHCDSDDWLEPDLIESCVKMIELYNAEMVLFGYNIFTKDSDGFHLYDRSYASKCVLTTKEEVREFFVHNYYNYFLVNSLCNKFLRRSFVVDNSLMVPPLRRSQDMAYALLVFDKLSRIVVVSECYYNYWIQPGVFNKGKSYSDTLDILYNVYKNTKATFNKWRLLSEEENRKLVNKTCELVANLTAHAVSVKYRKDWRKINKELMSRNEVVLLFDRYNGADSNFMKMFIFAVKSKVPIFIKTVSELHRLREKSTSRKLKSKL